MQESLQSQAVTCDIHADAWWLRARYIGNRSTTHGNFVVFSIARESPRRDDVVALIRQSDALMRSLYPAESNHLVDIESLAQPQAHLLVVRGEGRALGCGAFVLGGDGQAEMKRMFVDPAARGKGIAGIIMEALEREAAKHGVTLMQLETG